jgi:diaminohydroxyphosphoribosylaminopyrimidine deaminase/5-amino-6-(5-phosphoribosylamino)uracil reductase
MNDSVWMQRALTLAKKGLFTTKPNPRVGCVLVKDNKIVGEGWHQFSGGPHAEVEALKMAGEQARGATCYVTLEPCAHVGKTGPCSKALIEAGIVRVVAAMKDPNVLVSGKGFAECEAAGISCKFGLFESEARAVNPGFIKMMTERRPWVRVKLGVSLDGRTALANGESQWITSPLAREDVQQWRAQSSAIITGIKTVLADDPSLNVRLDNVAHQPVRIVLDSKGQMPTAAKMLSLPGKTIVVTQPKQCH